MGNKMKRERRKEGGERERERKYKLHFKKMEESFDCYNFELLSKKFLKCDKEKEREGGREKERRKSIEKNLFCKSQMELTYFTKKKKREFERKKIVEN